MKKLIAVIVAVLTLACLFVVSPKSSVNAQTHSVIVHDYNELKNAISSANSSDTVIITLANDVAIQGSFTVKGNIVIKGNAQEKLIFDYNCKKTSLSFSKNTNLTIENVTISRTVADETETYLFRVEEKQVTMFFNECNFEVATLEFPSIQYDRIVYSSSGVSTTFTCYLNNCVYNTAAYFYRGTYVFYNCDSLPEMAGSAAVKDFSGLKIDYESGKLVFPSDITVCEDESFTQTVKSGSALKSEFTYYALKGGYKFSFTTRNLKCETPDEASVNVDFTAEKIYFGEEFKVYSTANLSQAVNSGDSIFPGQTLYVVRKGSGIFIDSDVFEYQLPQRPEVRELNAAFVCSFGFAMEHLTNYEYRVNGGEWQMAPVFVGLEASTQYTVELRVKETSSSFVSEIYTLKVTTSEK